MKRCFFSTVVGKTAAKSPFIPFQSPYFKNVVNKAQFGPKREKPSAESLMNDRHTVGRECDDETPSEIPAADHFWTARVNADVERLRSVKRSDNEMCEESVSKKHTMTANAEPAIIDAAKKTMGMRSHTDALHEAIAGEMTNTNQAHFVKNVIFQERH